MTIQDLKDFGANTDEGLARCINNEDFYMKMVRMAVNDGGYASLAAALEKKDLKAAFEAAHSLKGILGNLALTPMFEPASEMTELLRAGKDIDYTPYLEEIMKQHAKLVKICEG